LVDKGSWFSSTNIVLWDDIQAIGADAIIVNSRAAEISADQVPEVKQVLEQDNALKGITIMTTDGRDLGTMVDIYFDEQSGQIEGYELFGGVFSDATGCSFMPIPKMLQLGQDVAFVPPETMSLMQEHAGDIEVAIQSASEDMQEPASTDANRLHEASASTAASLTTTSADPVEQKAFVVGKTAKEDVTAPDGTLLVAADQTITLAVVEEAERRGVLDRLYQAAVGSFPANTNSAVRSAFAGQIVAQAKGRRVQHTVKTDKGVVIAAPGQIVTDRVIERAQTYNKAQALVEATGLSDTEAVPSGISATSFRPATNVWERIREAIKDMRERSAQGREEQRIKEALGRPVDRVILDQQDHIILNVGELITNRSIERARQAGVLDVLLNSVYPKSPELSQAELRAPEPGDASLENNRL
jgi:uncharacterized protein YrrD